jgi:ArsR family transcriptional regulator
MKVHEACVQGLSIEMLERVGTVLRLLANPYRLKIIEMLEQNEAAPVYRIAEEVGLAPAATSQHLNQMKNLGIVRSERRGKEVWYAIDDDRSLSILHCIQSKAEEV